MGIDAIIGIVVGITGAVFGLVTFFRNKRTDDEEDGKKDGIVLTELGYIKSGVDDIKRKQEKQDERNEAFATELVAVKESAKQAHKRIDTLEGRVNGGAAGAARR